eukprot:1936434-Rhodomonas_salina.5
MSGTGMCLSMRALCNAGAEAARAGSIPPIVLRLCYALSGTEHAASRATASLCNVRCWYIAHIMLWFPHVMSGTGSTSQYQTLHRQIRHSVLRRGYAMSGTKVGHGGAGCRDGEATTGRKRGQVCSYARAMRCPVLTYYMMLLTEQYGAMPFEVLTLRMLAEQSVIDAREAAGESAICLRGAMSGTDIAYGDAMSGTDIVYGGACPVLA